MGKTEIEHYMATERKCALCNSAEQNELFYGELLSNNTMAVHTFCLYLTSNLMQNGEDDEDFYGFLIEDIKKEARRVRPLRCIYCGELQANIGCCLRKCPRVYHLTCGLKSNVEYQFINSFNSFCHTHAQKSNEKPKTDDICYICYEELTNTKCSKSNSNVPSFGMRPLRAPCCRNGWFHKACLQKCANTAGYFFKCPLCNDAKVFREQIRYQGIFIPDRDAAWELEPHAYDELLERPRICAAKRCLIRSTRKRAEENFIYCSTCGSVAVHNYCLPKNTSTFNCEDCCKIITTSNETKAKVSANDSDNGDDRENNTDVDVCALDDALANENATTSSAASSCSSTVTHSTSENLKNISCIAHRTRHMLDTQSPSRTSPKTTTTNEIITPERKSLTCCHSSSDSEDSSDSDMPIRLFHKRRRFRLSSSSDDDDDLPLAVVVATATPSKSNAAAKSDELSVPVAVAVSQNAQTQVAPPIVSASNIAHMTTLTALDSDFDIGDSDDDDPLNNISALLEIQNKTINEAKSKSVECIVISDSSDSEHDNDSSAADCNKENENPHTTTTTTTDSAQQQPNNNNQSAFATRNTNNNNSNKNNDDYNSNENAVENQEPMSPFDISCIANRTRRRSCLRAHDKELTTATTSQSNANNNNNSQRRTRSIPNLRSITQRLKRVETSPSILVAKRARQQQQQQQPQLFDNVDAKTNANMNTILSSRNLDPYIEPSFERVNGKLHRVNSFSSHATSSSNPCSFRSTYKPILPSSVYRIQKQNSL